MPYGDYLKKYDPRCPSCNCVITRIGVYCQNCRNDLDLEQDECICDDWGSSPSECKSRLHHFCCCKSLYDTINCRATRVMHDCTCDKDPDDCRADDHPNYKSEDGGEDKSEDEGDIEDTPITKKPRK